MSEKRFKLDWSKKVGIHFVLDTNTDERIDFYSDVVELLNEQQSTISKQLDQIIELQDKYRILEFNHKRLKERNKKQYGKIGEQQATISRLESDLQKIPPKIREVWLE